ncbi:MAG TPA: transglutaminase-like domain-containing protein [Bacteroidales bacterium]|nr:transglutaminase-like domain-containing protein [Bacteroidales bacterium]
MTELTTNRELSALLHLLDEPDENAFGQIEEKIFTFGREAIPLLEKTGEESLDGLVQERVGRIIRKIRSESSDMELETWIKTGSSDLLKGIILITRTQFPDLDIEDINIRIEQLKMDAWLELNENLTALENVKVLNHILFQVHHFEGNRVEPYAPDNLFIHTLLDSRKGSPLSLGMLYIIIAQKLNIPVFGVNLPQHFILAYASELGMTLPETEDILFYIDPFNKGSVFTRREIELFVRQLKIKPDPAFFSPCSNIDIIKRMINNLIFSYSQAGNQEKAEEFHRLLKIFTPEDDTLNG